MHIYIVSATETDVLFSNITIATYIHTLDPPQSHVGKFEEVHSQIDQPQQTLERTIAVYWQQHAVRMLSIPFPPVAWMHHEVGVFLYLLVEVVLVAAY